MAKPIINIDELEFAPFPAPMPDKVKAKYEGAKMGFASRRIGAKKLGYSVVEIPAGKRAFPFHNHRVNEEAFFIIEGSGEVRVGKETFPIRKGDFIANPPGGEEAAHQIINTGSIPMRYLGISTQESPEIAEYPDSKKKGILAFLGMKDDGTPDMFRYLIKDQPSADYWEGE